MGFEHTPTYVDQNAPIAEKSPSPDLKFTDCDVIVQENADNLTTDDSLSFTNDKLNFTSSTNTKSETSNGFSDVFSPDKLNYEFIMDKLADFEDQLNIEKNKNRVLQDEMNDIQNDFTKFKKGLSKVKNDQTKTYNDIDDLYERVYSMDCILSECDQYSRRESLVISGIPEYINQQNLEFEVLNILGMIGLYDVSSYQIVACHRLMKKSNDKYPARTIVRFTNRKIVEFCISNRDRVIKIKQELKMNIRFYEHLSKSNENILKECQNLHKHELIHSYYIRNGFLKIIINQGDKPIKIINQEILDNLFAEYYDHDNLYSP